MFNEQHVPSLGSPFSQIALIGDCPGEIENLEKKPFAGSNYHLLSQMLIQAGLIPSNCYFTNVVKLRPKDNNFNSLYIDKKRTLPTEDLKRWWNFLQDEIYGLKANVLVPLGREALYALTGKSSIEHWRGSIFTLQIKDKIFKVIPTYHPTGIFRMYEHRAVAEMDFRKIEKESKFPELKLKERTFVLQPSLSTVLQYLDSIKDVFSFDIETTQNMIRCLGIAKSSTSAICIPFFSNSYSSIIRPTSSGGVGMSSINSYWTEEEEKEILLKLNELFLNPSIRKIAQNAPFDITRLEREFGFDVKNIWLDTMVAQHCCYSELPKGLDFLASIYTDIPYYSDYECADDLSTWKYNCFDCVATFECMEKLMIEMAELKVNHFYFEHAHPLMLSLAKIGNRGVLIDVKIRDEEKQKAEKELGETLLILKKITGFDFNPNSPKQCKELFYEKLRLPIQYKVQAREYKETQDEEALLLLKDKYPEHTSLIDNTLKVRGLTKLIGTFLSSTLSSDNHMCTSYNSTGTIEGRISSSKTLDGEGGNLQQVPHTSLRRMFIAPENKVFLKADASQAEARAVAWFARIQFLIDQFSDNPEFDVHKWNASIVFNKILEEISKNERQTAKQIVHGANYGIGHKKAAKLAGVSSSQAYNALNTYYCKLPELKKWWEEIQGKLQSSRRLYTPFGRLRIFFDRLLEETFRSAYAFLPASTVGDIINRAVFTLDKSLPDPENNFIVLQVHDELVIELEKNRVREIYPLVKKEFETPIKVEGVLKPLIIPVEIKIGKNWFSDDMIPLEQYLKES